MLSNILYKEAAAVAATTALHAAAVAKKRVAKIKGQLKNEAEKWKRWEADYRTQIRYAVERERRKEQQERTDMGLEDCDCKYAWLLEKHHDALKQQLASVQKFTELAAKHDALQQLLIGMQRQEIGCYHHNEDMRTKLRVAWADNKKLEEEKQQLQKEVKRWQSPNPYGRLGKKGAAKKAKKMFPASPEKPPAPQDQRADSKATPSKKRKLDLSALSQALEGQPQRPPVTFG